MEGTAIRMTDEARDLLLTWNVSINRDGTFIRKGEVVTPCKINPNINLEEIEEVAMEHTPHGAVRITYLVHPLSHTFECVVQKNEYAEEVLYFYIP